MAEQGRRNSTAEITTSSKMVHVDIDDYQPSEASFIEKRSQEYNVMKDQTR